jgi:hypothetical protein|tara:strand:- start:79 stop:576 length:498 start_codon:yes stop_codon:yes gene_type:complete
MLHTYNLFSVRVIHGKFIVPINIHKKIIKFVDENYIISNSMVSCVDGFQIHHDFDGKEELNKELNIHLNNTLRLNLDYGWLNVLGKNSYNKPHKHAGINVTHSAVLYLSSENNNITFTRDSDIFEIKPKIFEYIIFPYDLVHYVLPEERNEKRICYAFNLSTIGE